MGLFKQTNKQTSNCIREFHAKKKKNAQPIFPFVPPYSFIFLHSLVWKLYDIAKGSRKADMWRKCLKDF